MEMQIGFPGGVRVDARFGDHEVRTDQPISAGGDGSAPAPFDLFLASIATCAGFYALRFCQERGIDTTGLALSLRTVRDDERRRLAAIEIAVAPPPGFPQKYQRALLRAIDQCTVKKHILEPPRLEVTLDSPAAASAVG